ncbi:MAG: hypothetical protein JXB43_06655 [Dehalococcoidia bacterium]|nr:hypothetical protein [Dehalococcoidia bacterium]
MKNPTFNTLRFGLSLALGIIICLIIPAKPPLANAETMKWSVVDTPSSTGNVIVSPSEINDIAIGVDGRTFYAIDISNSKIYRSLNSGVTWDDLSSYLASAGATLPAWNVAMAPDNPNFVAVVTSNGGLPGGVFISTNGGANWQNTNCPAASSISAIAISPNYGSYDIAIGTRTGAGGGDIYVFKTVGTGSWASQGFSGDTLAAKFSPNYRADSSMVTVSTHATGTYINLGIHDTASNTTNWSNWGPAEVTTAGAGTSPNVAQVITADLELPADFSGQAPSLRRMYVSLDAPTANAGIYRFDDTVGYLLMPTPVPLRISSISYYGNYTSGKLLAGEIRGNNTTAAVITWFTDATTNCPGTCWYQAQKMPTGGGNSGFANAQVTWSPDGSRAYCATSSAPLNNPSSWPGAYLTGTPLDESALSLSPDNGRTWNQLSLIDTEISFLSDVAVTPTSDVIYLASINNRGGINNFDSIWRAIGSPTGQIWERVLCLLSTSNDLIMRTSNFGNDPTIYFASRLTSDLRQSLDGGQTWDSILPGANVTDFVVTGINDVSHIYVLDNNYARHGVSNVQTWQWSPSAATTLNTGHSITATPTGAVVVGDAAEGMVAYSLDSGVSFQRTTSIPAPGQMHIIADYRFQDALIIYATSDSAGSDIYNWVTGSNLGWTAMGAPGLSFYGLAQLGTFYGAWSNGGNTAVARTLEPEQLAPPYIEWDSMSVGLAPGVVFTREPVSLKISAGINLWAIDDRPYAATTGQLWNFYDCFSPSPQYTPSPPPSREVLFQAPTPASPVIDEVIPIYLDTGDIGDIVFKWKHPTVAIEYELWLAEDEGFSQITSQQTIKPGNPQSPRWELPDTISLEKDKKYYWKIRVSQAATGETGEGQWSKIMSFSIAAPDAEKTPQPGTTPAAPPNGSAEESEPLPWILDIPIWAYIAIAFLLVVLPVTVFFAGRIKR